VSSHKYVSSPTSNDLLERLIAKHANALPNNPMNAQSAVDTENIECAQAVNPQRKVGG
jgi:hypothetical protein